MDSDGDDVMEEGLRVLKKQYQVLEVAGEGAYGRVLKCLNVQTGKICAVKEFKVEPGDADADEVH